MTNIILIVACACLIFALEIRSDLLSTSKVLEKNSTVIVYPYDDTNKNRQPAHHNRRPVDVTGFKICDQNELLYPGDNEGDWTCDCKPGFLLDPATVKCHAAFSRGPCSKDFILVLTGVQNSIPQCIKNECRFGEVLYDGNCYPLNHEEACKKFSSILKRHVLLVANPSNSSSLICADENFIYECAENCCNSTKSGYQSICPENVQQI